jgi:hypothetical protein
MTTTKIVWHRPAGPAPKNVLVRSNDALSVRPHEDVSDRGRHTAACSEWIHSFEPGRLLIVDDTAACPCHGVHPNWWRAYRWQRHQEIIAQARVPVPAAMPAPAPPQPPPAPWAPRARPASTPTEPVVAPALSDHRQWLAVNSHGVVTLATECGDYLSHVYSKDEFAATELAVQIIERQQMTEDLEREDQRPDQVDAVLAAVSAGCPYECTCMARHDRKKLLPELEYIPRVVVPVVDTSTWTRYPRPEPTVRPTIHLPGAQDDLIQRCSLIDKLDPRQLQMASTYAGESRRDSSYSALPAGLLLNRPPVPTDPLWEDKCDERTDAKKKAIAAETKWRKENTEELDAALIKLLDWYEQNGYVVEQIGQGPEKRKQGQWCVRKDGVTITYRGVSQTPPEAKDPADRPCKGTVKDEQGRGRVCGKLGWVPQGDDGQHWPIEKDGRCCSNWFAVHCEKFPDTKCAGACPECGRATRAMRDRDAELDALRPLVIEAILSDQELRAELEANRGSGVTPRSQVARWSTAPRFAKLAKAWPEDDSLYDDLNAWHWVDSSRRHSDECPKGASSAGDGGYWLLPPNERILAEEREQVVVDDREAAGVTIAERAEEHEQLSDSDVIANEPGVTA